MGLKLCVKTRTECLESSAGGKSKKAFIAFLCFLYQSVFTPVTPTVVVFGSHSSPSAVYATLYNSISCPLPIFLSWSVRHIILVSP